MEIREGTTGSIAGAGQPPLSWARLSKSSSEDLESYVCHLCKHKLRQSFNTTVIPPSSTPELSDIEDRVARSAWPRVVAQA